MPDTALKLVRSLADEQHVAAFTTRLRQWLLEELSADEGTDRPRRFAESRARALLRATEAADDPTLSDFATLVRQPAGARLAVYDLLLETELADHSDVQGLAAVRSAPTSGDEPEERSTTAVAWLSLAMAAYALQRGYPLQQLDPASPPERYSPAGQIVWRTGQFLRQQIQRSTTERDRLSNTLAPRAGRDAATLEDMEAEPPVAPLPPHFRPPVPVRYPEVSRDTIHVDESEETPPPVTRGDPLVITEEDLPQGEQAEVDDGAEEQQSQPVRMPPIRIDRSQVEAPNPPSPLPPSGVIMPGSSTESRPGLTVAIREMFRSEEMKTTKLRVLVKERPNGAGLYGLQVKVSCKGIRSFVAGTTDRDGQFLAELPVRLDEGLTYDVEVTWPRELGGETERKSITLHADRTEFRLPFHHRLGTTPGTEEQGS